MVSELTLMCFCTLRNRFPSFHLRAVRACVRATCEQRGPEGSGEVCLNKREGRGLCAR
jgi:hypothetical protein